jgi:hypothetical protein
MKASFHKLAQREMNEAADYYESVVNGLGNEFLDEVSYAIEFVKKHPEVCPSVFAKTRRMFSLQSILLGSP